MSNSTAIAVMRAALQQYHYTESPPGSNRTKFGKWFGLNGEPWCAEFVCWSGAQPPVDNPIAKSANAADIQDLTVRSKGGKYILRQTANNTKKKDALPNVKFGDSISFNFSGGSSRQHTGLVVGRWGDSLYCIEGNTSLTGKGSQSNGGAVALRKRYYTTGVCIVRPAYKEAEFYKPSTPYRGTLPKLPKRGYFKYGDSGEKVRMLQSALKWANGYPLNPDGEFKGYTFAEVVIFQVAHGLEPDGQFGEKSMEKMEKLIKAHSGASGSTPAKKPAAEKKPAKKQTKAEKVAAKAIELAWPFGTKPEVYKGAPKPAYKKALDKVFPNRKHWSVLPRTGRSCDVFAGTVMRSCGVDKTFPRGLSEDFAHLKNKKTKTGKLYKATGAYKAKDIQPGDIIIYKTKKGGHICFCVKIGTIKFIADAGRGAKRYGMIPKKLRDYDPHKYRFFEVYRVQG